MDARGHAFHRDQERPVELAGLPVLEHRAEQGRIKQNAASLRAACVETNVRGPFFYALAPREPALANFFLVNPAV
jgi:hypothetical protein